jgi:hypothetical protein
MQKCMLNETGGGVAEKSRPSKKDVSFSARTPINFLSIHFCIALPAKLRFGLHGVIKSSLYLNFILIILY